MSLFGGFLSMLGGKSTPELVDLSRDDSNSVSSDSDSSMSSGSQREMDLSDVSETDNSQKVDKMSDCSEETEKRGLLNSNSGVAIPSTVSNSSGIHPKMNISQRSQSSTSFLNNSQLLSKSFTDGQISLNSSTESITSHGNYAESQNVSASHSKNLVSQSLLVSPNMGLSSQSRLVSQHQDLVPRTNCMHAHDKNTTMLHRGNSNRTNTLSSQISNLSFENGGTVIDGKLSSSKSHAQFSQSQNTDLSQKENMMSETNSPMILSQRSKHRNEHVSSKSEVTNSHNVIISETSNQQPENLSEPQNLMSQRSKTDSRRNIKAPPDASKMLPRNRDSMPVFQNSSSQLHNTSLSESKSSVSHNRLRSLSQGMDPMSQRQNQVSQAQSSSSSQAVSASSINPGSHSSRSNQPPLTLSLLVERLSALNYLNEARLGTERTLNECRSELREEKQTRTKIVLELKSAKVELKNVHEEIHKLRESMSKEKERISSDLADKTVALTSLSRRFDAQSVDLQCANQARADCEAACAAAQKAADLYKAALAPFEPFRKQTKERGTQSTNEEILLENICPTIETHDRLSTENHSRLFRMMLDGSSDDFEVWIAMLYQAQGYEAEHAGQVGDHGVDVKLRKNGEISIVQCKQYRRQKVPESDLRDLLGTMVTEKAAKGIFVTTSTFSPSCLTYASLHPDSLFLVDRERLLTMIKANCQKLCALFLERSREVRERRMCELKESLGIAKQRIFDQARRHWASSSIFSRRNCLKKAAMSASITSSPGALRCSSGFGSPTGLRSPVALRSPTAMRSPVEPTSLRRTQSMYLMSSPPISEGQKRTEEVLPTVSMSSPPPNTRQVEPPVKISRPRPSHPHEISSPAQSVCKRPRFEDGSADTGIPPGLFSTSQFPSDSVFHSDNQRKNLEPSQSSSMQMQPVQSQTNVTKFTSDTTRTMQYQSDTASPMQSGGLQSILKKSVIPPKRYMFSTSGQTDLFSNKSLPSPSAVTHAFSSVNHHTQSPTYKLGSTVPCFSDSFRSQSSLNQSFPDNQPVRPSSCDQFGLTRDFRHSDEIQPRRMQHVKPMHPMSIQRNSMQLDSINSNCMPKRSEPVQQSSESMQSTVTSVNLNSMQSSLVNSDSMQAGSMQPGSMQSNSMYPNSMSPNTSQPGMVQQGSMESNSMQSGSMQSNSMQPGSMQSTSSSSSRSKQIHSGSSGNPLSIKEILRGVEPKDQPQTLLNHICEAGFDRFRQLVRLIFKARKYSKVTRKNMFRNSNLAVLEVTKQDLRHVVHCKFIRFGDQISAADVHRLQEARASSSRYTNGILVTNRSFTKEAERARNAINQKSIHLWDSSKLLELLGKPGMLDRLRDIERVDLARENNSKIHDKSAAPSQQSSTFALTFQAGTRRPSTPWTPEEEACLMDGVRKFGTQWSVIFKQYPFKPGRNAMDLKDKHRNIVKKQKRSQRERDFAAS
eukprot:93355_1